MQYTAQQVEETYKTFKEQHQIFVPQQGKADTVYGEILRAVGYLTERHRNSGSDEFWLVGESSPVGHFAGYLGLVVDLKPLLSDCVFYRLRGEKYADFLTKLQMAALEGMKNHNNEPNKIDGSQSEINPCWYLAECDECGAMTQMPDLENDGLGRHYCPECANKHYQEQRKNGNI